MVLILVSFVLFAALETVRLGFPGAKVPEFLYVLVATLLFPSLGILYLRTRQMSRDLRDDPVRPIVSALIVILGSLFVATFAILLVLSVLDAVFPSSSATQLVKRYGAVHLGATARTDIISFFGGAISFIVAFVLFYYIPRLVARQFTHSPSWLPLPLLTFLVRSGVTVVDLGILVLGLYAGYWFGVFPRTRATDAVVASVGVASLKIVIAFVILVVKNAVTGASVTAGGLAVNAVVKAHRSPPKPPQA